MVMNGTIAGLVRGVLAERGTGTVVIALPGTDYRLAFRTPPGASLPPVGARLVGRLDAESLRVHAAAGGGRFVEPVYGEPRIIAGILREADPASRRLLIEAPVPVHVITPVDQDFTALRPGTLVNCHLRSGILLTPIPGAGGSIAPGPGIG